MSGSIYIHLVIKHRVNVVGVITDTAGTCSMLPREKAGVVDTQLKVINLLKVRTTDKT